MKYNKCLIINLVYITMILSYTLIIYLFITGNLTLLELFCYNNIIFFISLFIYYFYSINNNQQQILIEKVHNWYNNKKRKRKAIAILYERNKSNYLLITKINEEEETITLFNNMLSCSEQVKNEVYDELLNTLKSLDNE